MFEFHAKINYQTNFLLFRNILPFLLLWFYCSIQSLFWVQHLGFFIFSLKCFRCNTILIARWSIHVLSHFFLLIGEFFFPICVKTSQNIWSPSQNIFIRKFYLSDLIRYYNECKLSADCGLFFQQSFSRDISDMLRRVPQYFKKFGTEFTLL